MQGVSEVREVCRDDYWRRSWIFTGADPYRETGVNDNVSVTLPHDIDIKKWTAHKMYPCDAMMPYC